MGLPVGLTAANINLSPKIIADIRELHDIVVSRLKQINDEQSYAFPLRVKCYRPRGPRSKKWNRREEYKQRLYDPTAIKIVQASLKKSGYHANVYGRMFCANSFWGMTEVEAHLLLIGSIFVPIPIVSGIVVGVASLLAIPFIDIETKSSMWITPIIE